MLTLSSLANVLAIATRNVATREVQERRFGFRREQQAWAKCASPSVDALAPLMYFQARQRTNRLAMSSGMLKALSEKHFGGL